jgi:agmatine deiminase
MLLRHSNLSKVIFIVCEPGDKTGHVDGIVQFVDDDTVIVAELPEDYRPLKDSISKKDYHKCRKYLNEVADELDQHFWVLRMPELPPSKEVKEGMPSAFGNYTNFFRFQNVIFVPQFGVAEADSQACRILADAFAFMYPKIVPVDCRVLASYGGGLHCITWEY